MKRWMYDIREMQEKGLEQWKRWMYYIREMQKKGLIDEKMNVRYSRNAKSPDQWKDG